MAAALLLIQRKIEYKKGEILMLRIQQYVKAQSLEEAYTLLTKNRNNQILGGMCWLKNGGSPDSLCD